MSIRADVEIDVGVVSEILNVALMSYRDRGDLDGLGAARAIDASLRQNIAHFQIQRHVRLITLPARSGQRMTRGEVDALLAIHGRLQQLGQFHQQRHAFRRPRHALRDNLRTVCRDQKLGGFLNGGPVARGRRGEREFRNARRRAWHRIALNLGVADDEHGALGRRHRDVVGSHRGLGKMAQRQRLIIPLGVVANQRAQVLGAVHGLHTRIAPRAVGVVSDHHIDGHSIAVRVVDGHRGVL